MWRLETLFPASQCLGERRQHPKDYQAHHGGSQLQAITLDRRWNAAASPSPREQSTWTGRGGRGYAAGERALNYLSSSVAYMPERPTGPRRSFRRVSFDTSPRREELPRLFWGE